MSESTISDRKGPTRVGRPTRVLIVEDSSFMRGILHDCLRETPGIDILGFAENGLTALSQTLALRPDVITLDINLPYLNGLESLTRIMERRPTPVLVLSHYTTKSSAVSLEALERGAVDFMHKPNNFDEQDLPLFNAILVKKIREVAGANLASLKKLCDGRGPIERAMPFVKPTSSPEESDSHPGRVVVVGASTGGPLALHWILRNMPRQLPVPVVVVQHMPSGYDHHLRRRLDAAGPLEVIVPKEPVPLRSGCVYVAPSGRHSVLRRRKSSFLLDFEPGSGLSEYIPSIDVLFRSAAALAGEQAIGILLTGMGSDGVHGLGAIQKAGGLTVAQDESTSTIFGMPREAAATGAAVMILPIEKIAELIVASTNRIWAPSPS